MLKNIKKSDISYYDIFWNNSLLKSCAIGELTLSDFRYFFSQYYFYTKNFTRILATFLVKCDDDRLRATLIHNFVEESGVDNNENISHTDIFRAFLKNTLGIDSLHSIKKEPYTNQFINNLMDLCLQSDVIGCAAILAFATEGIVPQLYTIFKQGLLKIGIEEDKLLFLNLHITCDDEHARILENIVMSYKSTPGWYESICHAINKAMEIRANFFNNIYYSLQKNKINELMEEITSHSDHKKNIGSTPYSHMDQLSHLNRLYQNSSKEQNIDFSVDRLPFNPSILDPRILTIKPNSNNELHRHAHESFFFVIKGKGRVLIETEEIDVTEGSFIYVERWLAHRTSNIGNENLVILAITDFNFTKRLKANSENSYRQLNACVMDV